MDTFKRVREAWPVVESRAGRDLGEYIKVASFYNVVIFHTHLAVDAR